MATEHAAPQPEAGAQARPAMGAGRAEERRVIPQARIINGDCREKLRELPDASVNCCVTSPPYFGLRDYGHPGQIGLEPTPDAYVAEMVAVFREVRRVLRDDGTCWLNLGDSYGGGHGGSKTNSEKQKSNHGTSMEPRKGNLPKQLLGIPWRVAFALQADGWYLRQDIIWHKPNPMPESVTDRCTKAHEYIFLLTKSARYWYDAEAVKEDTTGNTVLRKSGAGPKYAINPTNGDGTDSSTLGMYDTGYRNRRSVWTVATQPYSEAHFATFPPALITPCILAGCPAKVCAKCGAPWERVVEKDRSKDPTRHTGRAATGCKDRQDADQPRMLVTSRTIGHRPTCECETTEDDASGVMIHRPAEATDMFAYQPIPGTVLDPFGGSGTTGQVALDNGRNAILIELNPEYMKLANDRTNVTPGMPI